MEAFEGRRDEARLGNDNKTPEVDDPVERWIEEIRKDLEAADRDEQRFESLRAEAMYWRVLRRINDERARVSWTQRVRRALRSLASIGSILWNSRAARFLMP